MGGEYRSRSDFACSDSGPRNAKRIRGFGCSDKYQNGLPECCFTFGVHNLGSVNQNSFFSKGTSFGQGHISFSLSGFPARLRAGHLLGFGYSLGSCVYKLHTPFEAGR